MDPSSPASVLEGRWRIEKRIGKGGMGSVFLAYELDLDRYVAIKQLAANIVDNDDFVKRFEREARIMARFDHPNLVPVYAVGRNEGVPFIVMKYLEGDTLSSVLKKGRLELGPALAIARQICAGLQFVHERGVVHRDIKPANIIVAANGHVTVLDLGVAHDPGSSLTQSGMMVGTPRYMAPEQIVGSGVDHRADLYSVAVVIYEMLSGRTLFEADSDYSQMKAHVDEAPPDLTRFASVPRAFADALAKGLSKAAEQRFSSASELMAALDAGAAPAATAADSGAKQIPVTAQQWAMDTATEVKTAPMPHDVAASKMPPRKRAGLSQGAWFGLLGVGATAGTALMMVLQMQRHAEELAQAKRADIAAAPERAAALVRPSEPQPAARPEQVKGDEVVVAETAPRVLPSAQAPTGVPEATPQNSPSPDPVAGVPASVHAAVPAAKRGPAEVRCVTITADGDASWAYVDVDGMRQGATPLTLKLEPGKHALVFQRPGFKTQTVSLATTAGEVKKLRIEMVP